MSKTKSVAIVGAGACGLVCAKVLLDDGFDVTLFERHQELGGIWCAESAYTNLHAQQPGGTMEFSDLFDGEGKLCHIYSHNNVMIKFMC
jgi:dimethylaniline monooxygenase (N-oxide forming)